MHSLYFGEHHQHFFLGCSTHSLSKYREVFDVNEFSSCGRLVDMELSTIQGLRFGGNTPSYWRLTYQGLNLDYKSDDKVGFMTLDSGFNLDTRELH